MKAERVAIAAKPLIDGGRHRGVVDLQDAAAPGESEAGAAAENAAVDGFHHAAAADRRVDRSSAGSDAFRAAVVDHRVDARPLGADKEGATGEHGSAGGGAVGLLIGDAAGDDGARRRAAGIDVLQAAEADRRAAVPAVDDLGAAEQRGARRADHVLLAAVRDRRAERDGAGLDDLDLRVADRLIGRGLPGRDRSDSWS